MKRTGPDDDDTRQCEGRLSSRARRESSDDSGHAPTSKDRPTQLAPESRADAPDSEDDVVVLGGDGGSDENWRPPPLEPEPNYTAIACTKCTFENIVQSSSVVASAQSPPSLLCEVCSQPLPRQQQHHRDHSPLHFRKTANGDIETSSNSVSVLAKSGSRGDSQQGGSRHGFSNEGGRGDSRTISEPQITAADFLPAYTNDEVPGVQCQSCTVVVPAGLDTGECPVCLAPLNESTSTTGQLCEGWLPSLECAACTLRNEPGSTICSACETPLDDGQIGSQHKSPQRGMQGKNFAVVCTCSIIQDRRCGAPSSCGRPNKSIFPSYDVTAQVTPTRPDRY